MKYFSRRDIGIGQWRSVGVSQHHVSVVSFVPFRRVGGEEDRSGSSKIGILGHQTTTRGLYDSGVVNQSFRETEFRVSAGRVCVIRSL